MIQLLWSHVMYAGYRSAMVCFPSRHLILYLATSKHLKEMAVAVTIDFNNTYEIEPVSDDLLAALTYLTDHPEQSINSLKCTV